MFYALAVHVDRLKYQLEVSCPSRELAQKGLKLKSYIMKRSKYDIVRHPSWSNTIAEGMHSASRELRPVSAMKLKKEGKKVCKFKEKAARVDIPRLSLSHQKAVLFFFTLPTFRAVLVLTVTLVKPCRDGGGWETELATTGKSFRSRLETQLGSRTAFALASRHAQRD